MKNGLRQFRMTFRRFVEVFREVLLRGEINQNSIVIAYYVLFSLFPMIIVFGNVLPFFRINTAPLTHYLAMVFPQTIAKFVIPIVNTLLRKHSGGFMSFGIIFAVWSFSRLTNSIRIAMNRIYGVYAVEKGMPWWNYFLLRSITFLLTTIMVILFASVIFILTFGEQILAFLSPIFNLEITWFDRLQSYRWPIIVGVMIMAVAYLNYVLPNISIRKRIVWPGVLVTVVGWLALSYFFSLYLHYFGTRWENYGIIGTLIIFMLWLNISSTIFLFGVSINASIDIMKYGGADYTTNWLITFLKHRRHHLHS